MTDSVWPDERAGWWRRTLALMIDSACVIAPSIILGALLFAGTGGFLQWSEPGLQWQLCKSVTQIPADLRPPPPKDSNEAAVCQTQSIAGQIGAALIVGRTTRESGSVSTVAMTYLLQRSGQIGGHDVSWITYAALLILLVTGEWRSGTTPGKRLLGLRVIAAEDPERRSIPLKRVAIRYAIAIAGVLLPLGLALAIILIPVMEGKQPSAFPLFAL